MTPYTVICPACGWIGHRCWQQADAFGIRHYDVGDGLGRCFKCQAPVVRKPRATTGRDRARERDARYYGEGR